jgi:hypothetical protein
MSWSKAFIDVGKGVSLGFAIAGVAVAGMLAGLLLGVAIAWMLF